MLSCGKDRHTPPVTWLNRNVFGAIPVTGVAKYQFWPASIRLRRRTARVMAIAARTKEIGRRISGKYVSKCEGVYPSHAWISTPSNPRAPITEVTTAATTITVSTRLTDTACPSLISLHVGPSIVPVTIS